MHTTVAETIWAPHPLRRPLAIALFCGMLTAIAWQGYTLNRAQQEAAEQAAKVQLALQGSQSGMWFWTPTDPSLPLMSQGDSYTWYGPLFRGMLGYAGGDFQPHLQTVLALIHPDDMEQLETAVLSCFNGADMTLQVECRLRHHDDSYHWYRLRGSVSRNADGRVTQMAGSITPTDATRNDRLLLYGLFDTLPDAVVVCDEERRIIVFNRAIEQLTGFSRRDVAGKSADDVLLPPDVRETHKKAYTVAARLLMEQPSTEPLVRIADKWSIQCRNGQQKQATVTLRSIRYGDRLAFMAHIREVTP